KEESNYILTLKLRINGIITTLEVLFKETDRAEIDSLIIGGIFKFYLYNPLLHSR
ncbi:hypothetical protein CC78DRAFT_463823, partial [Lojkania enalia]